MIILFLRHEVFSVAIGPGTKSAALPANAANRWAMDHPLLAVEDDSLVPVISVAAVNETSPLLNGALSGDLIASAAEPAEPLAELSRLKWYRRPSVMQFPIACVLLDRLANERRYTGCCQVSSFSRSHGEARWCPN